MHETRKPESPPENPSLINIFRAEILVNDLYNSGFSKKQISGDLQESTRIVGKKIRHFQPGTVQVGPVG